MNSSFEESYRQMLVHRLGPMQIALEKFVGQDEEAGATIRNLAASLVPFDSGNIPSEINMAASNVLLTPDDKLKEAVERLFQAMRAALAKPLPASVILIIGGDPVVNETFAKQLPADNRKVLCTWTAAEARVMLQKEDVVFIILNLFLPDIDGRKFLTELKNTPFSATIPLLVVDEIGVGDWIKDNGLLLGADGYILRPIDMSVVTDQVRHLLRRAHHTVNGPRRDPVTGLLNRAAMPESYQQAVATCRSAGEPVSLMLVGISGNESISHASMYWDDLMQRIGQVLSKSFRSSDVLIRWSVHEFAALLPGTNRTCAVVAAEKVQKIIRREILSNPEAESRNVSACAGVIEIRCCEDDLDASMDKVYKCLFSAQLNRMPVVSDQADTPEAQHRVLLFHDLKTARPLQQILLMQGVEVVTAEDPNASLIGPLDISRYHLVIIDEQLQRNGLKALASIRAIRTYDRVPVLMLLRQNAGHNAWRALELGASDCITAPFLPKVFASRVQHFISRGKLGLDDEIDLCDVLIADNDTTLLVTAASALKQHGGFSVCLANGAEDALTRFRAKQPNVVILDAWMAREDGVLLLHLLRTEKGPSSMAVIGMVSKDCPQQRIQEIEPYVKGVIKKPFNPLTLASEIGGILKIKLTNKQSPENTAMLNSEIGRALQAQLGRIRDNNGSARILRKYRYWDDKEWGD